MISLELENQKHLENNQRHRERQKLAIKFKKAICKVEGPKSGLMKKKQKKEEKEEKRR